VKIHPKEMADFDHTSVSRADYVIITVGLVSPLLKTYISNPKEEITTYLFGTVQSLNFFNDEPMKDEKKNTI